MPQDRVLQEPVLIELVWEPRVMLNGTVPTLADRHVVCQITWKSRGATEVENDLVVA